MPSLIVIRIVPQKPTDPLSFTSALAAGGGLSITVTTLSFASVDNQPPGANSVTVSYIPLTPSTGWATSNGAVFPNGAVISSSLPPYPAGLTGGIIQQVDYVPSPNPGIDPFPTAELQAVATAVIQVPWTAPQLENISVTAKRGGQTILADTDYYALVPNAIAVPDLSTWSPSGGSTVQDLWAQQPANLYLTLPPAPSSNPATSVQLPSNGTPPPFDALLTAVNAVLALDPGPAAITAAVAVPGALAGATQLPFGAAPGGVTVGMAVSGPPGIAPGTTVASISGGTVTLSEEISAAIVATTPVNFTWALGSLSLNQCRNIAYELLWIQQQPLPTPPDPIENLYTNPPNTGDLTSGGSSVNQDESDRQQFEAQLQTYYASTNANADRLTNFIYALSAAVACEQMSLAAPRALIEFPAQPGQPGADSSNDESVILTGLDTVGGTAHFGVPAAYFYAIGANTPTSRGAVSRYSDATGDQLAQLLSELTSAINAQTILDGEGFVASGVAGTINAAQSARRIAALGVPRSSSTALAPLNTVALPTSQATQSGQTLNFASLAGLATPLAVSGQGIAPGTNVSALNTGANTVALSLAVLAPAPAGTSIVFTPTYSASLSQLVTDWLAFPATTAGTISSQAYQPGDDDALFWPSEATTQPQGLLELVLCALTDGYIIPAPFSIALGNKILAFLTTLSATPTVDTLAGVTQAQWTALFTPNPTWLPPQPGGFGAQLSAFIETVRNMFPVGAGGPVSVINLATSAPTNTGPSANILTFAATTGVQPGWSVSSLLTMTNAQGQVVPVIPVGTQVSTTAGGLTATTVTLTNPVNATVLQGTNITFRPTISTTSSTSLTGFAVSNTTDPLWKCLNAYNASYQLGAGTLTPVALATPAAGVCPNDPAAQAYLIEALITIDTLCAIVATATGTSVTTAVGGPASPAPLPGAVGFSIVEALYACGFHSAADIIDISPDDFTQALLGTPAFTLAPDIYKAAGGSTSTSPQQGEPGFHPINPDGSLVNCIPPPCLSPLGPVAYLAELLQLTENSTCDKSIAPAPTERNPSEQNAIQVHAEQLWEQAGRPAGGALDFWLHAEAALQANGTVSRFPPLSLATALAQRRGPLGNLDASCANLETPLPLIDIVNECLEYLGAAATPSGGTVYDTAADTLAGFPLCQRDDCPPAPNTAPCHDPARIFAALPEHSTPADPTTDNSAVQPAVYDTLKADFSAPSLPYAQALDVNRSILRHFGSCRFEAMRSFRRCITEFALLPDLDPPGFDDQVWRYPVRIDMAIEYLGITPEEYTTVFQGAPIPPCGTRAVRDGNTPPGNTPAAGGAQAAPQRATAPDLLRIIGLAAPADATTPGTLLLPAFLRGLGLTYCEFFELWNSGFVTFGSRPTGSRDNTAELGKFPPCEPCCLDDLTIGFPRQVDAETGLLQLAVFVRLWRKLREPGCCGYTFGQLHDICDVLQLFIGNSLNPEFIRQFAAFQMLRDDFHLPLNEGTAPSGAVDAARSPLLALWVTPQPPQFSWAVRKLVEGIAWHARRRHGCQSRGPEFLDRLASELNPLSRLAGFDPTSATDNWHAAPNHTLRFAEVLAKLYASDFHLADVRYLFTVDALPDARSPFPQQEPHEALARPLDLPDGEHEVSLLRLRHRLLEVEVPEEELHHWHWSRTVHELRTAFGFAEADIIALGAHFFPHMLEHAGFHVAAADRRFTSALAAASTSPATWDTPLGGPFQYDPGAGMLWTMVPLTDAAVLAKLGAGHDFNAQEQTAIQDLYFQPRAMLAHFGLLFPDFPAAVRAMVETHGHEERWAYFRLCVALCWRRRRIIAEHLCRHVSAVTGVEEPHCEEVALLLLNALYADENALAPGNPTPSWENQDGTHPAVLWTPPNGDALAGLLALVGTGLIAEYAVAGGGTVWRDPVGALNGFGHERDRENCPVPTVLPALNATVLASQSAFVSAHNGLLFAAGSNAPLGGAQGFTVTFTGALLIDREGPYEFWAGAPRYDDERPDFDAEPGASWNVTLQRGARTWVLSSRGWTGQEDRRFASVPLRPGAYELTIELTQPGPDFTSAAGVRGRHTGLALHYAGPDSDDVRIPVPHRRLLQVFKDNPLGQGLTGLSPGATLYQSQLYVGSLRDIRRTYQRAFKALLFVQRFRLRAAERPDEPSELGYMLDHAANFAGTGFVRTSPTSFTYQTANFDFNYLPVLDDFHPPATDQRVQPSPQRTWAMFDWWERMFDYVALRESVRRRHRGPWRLFQDAADQQPADPGYLLHEIGAPEAHWAADLQYFQTQGAPPYTITATDLEDERWTIRAWRADRWLDAMQRAFAARDLSAIRPDLWVDDNPAAIAGQVTGNGNLLAFLCDNAFVPDEPRRYEAVRIMNDGLRQRARDALTTYLCSNNRVPVPWGTGLFARAPVELSALLLIDVETGVVERASRIEEAITAVQTFVRRARLGLETSWAVTGAFAQMWDRQFSTYQVWRACKARHLYKEDWLEWTELAKARRVDAFRFLEKRLEAGGLTVAEPGGEDWWPHPPLPHHDGLPLAERREPVQMALLSPARGGLGILATPERAARPSWLAALPPQVTGGAGAGASATGGTAIAPAAQTPLWLQSAIRLGVNFVRLAAAGAPLAAHRFAPFGGHRGCVNCCETCGCEHEPAVDEYYFWLIGGRYFDNAPLPAGVQPTESNDGYEYGFQDDFYDATQQQSAFWQDPTQLPQLLLWQSLPMVRLAWCRVHNGQFLQPQRSAFGVAVQPGNPVDLSFTGRTGDSLFFQVLNGTAPQGNADPSAPGFRYDLASDEALTLPQVSAPAPVSALMGGLPAFPWFAYAAPGSPVFPLSSFSPALAVARWLRAHCRFEAALRWARLAFDPLSADCAWIRCEPQQQTSPPAPSPSVGGAAAAPQAVIVPPAANPQAACCDSADVGCAKAEQRAILLFYLETLAEWGHAMMRRLRTPEAAQQARVIFDAARMILGRRPVSVMMPEPATTVQIGAFTPAFAPLNPRLLDIYDRVADQLALIHHGIDARRLPDAGLRGRAPYFGESPPREGWRTEADHCLDEGIWCHPPSPYRFTFLIQKALDYAGKAQELGGALLAAFEKGDAEYLAALRAGHEREVLRLSLDGKKDQWREADWQVESLQKAKAVSQANLNYYTRLINVNLIDGELQYENYINSALSLRSAAIVVEAIGEGLRLIPDFVVGGAGFGGSPVAISWLPLGTKLGDMFAAVARIMNDGAQIDSETAQLDLTEAGWVRRYADWVHQQQVMIIDIQQNERQILGAQRRRDQMLKDINTHQRQIEQSVEVDGFLRDKFTSHDLYLFMQRELAALYYQTYDLALDAARQAEQAFNLERGHTTRHFLAECLWDDLREGLTAGERLSAAVRRMEKSYYDENVREYELTKHISLRLSFPMAFLQLRTTGQCEIDIPEWMFDQDFPGQYMRRIRSVSLTIPCVAGPYTGVHCRLTLIDSTTRIDPRLDPPPHSCCCPPPACPCGRDREPGSYRLCPDDPRAVRIYGEREAIATSGGQNDSGLFELSFNDPRYVPFEYMGAISHWRVELPPENNYFDPDTLTDLVVHLNYTAREGGDVLRDAAMRAARCKLPGDGWAFFDVRHDFADAWELLRRQQRVEEEGERTLTLRLSRRFFPFLPRNPRIRISRLIFCFQVEPEDEDPCPEFVGCPCTDSKTIACHEVTLRRPRAENGHRRGAERIVCHADPACAGLYVGTTGLESHAFRRGVDVCELEFCLPSDIAEMAQAYLFCRYDIDEPCCCDPIKGGFAKP